MTTTDNPSRPAILALVSAPLVDQRGEPVARLDVERELCDLATWLGEPGRAAGLHVEWAEAARLQRALLRRRFDLLHFTGHGGADGRLAFEDGRGGLHPLDAGQLAGLVCPGGELAFRLAFLSACHSEGLADALLQAGLPHVVAIRADEPISDLAAATFGRVFYAALLAGRTVAAAFAGGQTAVRTQPDLARRDLAESEAAKFRLLPEPGDHDAVLFAPGLPGGEVARRDPPASPHRLGPRPETLTGRQRELHELLGHVLKNRLTVLTGMGGMGKTELAREAGRWLAARGHFSGGIGWADLRGVRELSLLRARLAEAAGLSPETARGDAELAAALATRDDRLLIVDDLDEAVRHNFAGLRALLAAVYQAGGPHLLLTSRERLGRRPPAQYQNLGHLVDDEAADLFVRHARLAGATWTPAEAADLAAVLDFLDGWPLALVLAVPLLADYSPAALRRRLDEEKERLLDDPALSETDRGKLDSVDVSLSLSYDHLAANHPEAARVFGQLALFPGGAGEAALRAVLGPGALAAVARLRAASLVEAEPGGDRVRLPAPARAYAERRLPAADRERCGPPALAHYLARLEALAEVPISHPSGLSLAATLAELPNLHAWADWGLARDDEAAAPRRPAGGPPAQPIHAAELARRGRGPPAGRRRGRPPGRRSRGRSQHAEGHRRRAAVPG